MVTEKMSLQFGEFELDRERRQLLRSGQPVPLEPKAYELLVLLVERRPRALSRAGLPSLLAAPARVVAPQGLDARPELLGDDQLQELPHPLVFLVLAAYGELPLAFALPAGLGDVAVGIGAPVTRLHQSAEFFVRTMDELLMRHVGADVIFPMRPTQ